MGIGISVRNGRIEKGMILGRGWGMGVYREGMVVVVGVTVRMGLGLGIVGYG